MIKYKINVLEALNDQGYSSYKLYKDGIMGSATIQKLRKNEVVYGKNLNLICSLLNRQPGELLEYIPDEK